MTTEVNGWSVSRVRDDESEITDLLLAILDEAETLDIAVVGHVPHSVAASTASDAGLRTLEHLQGLLEDSSAAGDRLRASTAEAMSLMPRGEQPPAELITEVRGGRLAVVDEYDPGRARHLYERLQDNGTRVTPTLVSNRGLLVAPDDPGFAEDPRLAYLPETWTEDWFGEEPDADTRAADRRSFERLLEIVGALHEVGVPLLAGTDLGVPHVFPGFSLHDELELLVRAGLDEASALRAATVEPARLFDPEHSGAVAPGNRADLVLLDADPLDRIDATRSIHAVVLAGRLLASAALEELHNRARERASGRVGPGTWRRGDEAVLDGATGGAEVGEQLGPSEPRGRVPGHTLHALDPFVEPALQAAAALALRARRRAATRRDPVRDVARRHRLPFRTVALRQATAPGRRLSNADTTRRDVTAGGTT